MNQKTKNKRTGITTIPCPGVPMSIRYFYIHRFRSWDVVGVDQDGNEIDLGYDSFPSKAKLMAAIPTITTELYSEYA